MYHYSRTSFNIFKGNFEGKIFDWDPPFRRFSARFWVVCSNFCRNVFRAVVETAFYVSRGKSRLVFFRKICGFFSKFEQTFIEVLNVKFHHCPQNNLQHIQRNNWGKKFSSLFSKIFPILSDLFLQFCQKYFRRVVTIDCFVYGRDI